MSAAPDTTTNRFDDGRVPVSAEAIEHRLRELWQMMHHEQAGKRSLVRLCLSNMVVITDERCRPEAERLAGELTALQPSRVFLVVIDETLTDFSAQVRTACNLSTGSDSAICWEIIEMYCPEACEADLPGALRSLLVGTVPVVTVDFRHFQKSPAFDSIILELSDYYFVNAEIVPTGELRRHFLPLRWYRTLPVRELLSTLFARILESTPERFPVEITVHASSQPERIDVLLVGWFIHRLATAGQVRAETDAIIIPHEKGDMHLIHRETPDANGHLIGFTFGDGDTIAVVETSTERGFEAVYAATYGDNEITRSLADYPIGRYIIEAIRQPSEFHEYDAVRKVVMAGFRLPEEQ
ncbi:MAG: hypothetical protein D6800_06870 [Candidatus Zixiibacteriota bacterium]|nr:MAG: hypothetical protein D6800_06870 [candidate division Zixibacteria bacterium]